MPTYMTCPQTRVEVGSRVFENRKALNWNITWPENAFPVARVLFSDIQSRDRSEIIEDAVVAFKVKQKRDAAWTTMLNGKVRFVTEGLGGDGESILATVDGAGFGFAETICNQEYGAQSLYPGTGPSPSLSSLKEIITDDDYGIVPAYVNHLLANLAADTGYDYDVSLVDDIVATVPYLYFPLKPNSKCLCDLIDLVQAVLGTSAGPHWLVTQDDYLLVTTVKNHSADAISKGWTTYVNGAVADATFVQKKDFQDFRFEKLSSGANYIAYYSGVYHPKAMDWWTEDTDEIDHWDVLDGLVQGVVADDTKFKVGLQSAKAYWLATNGPYTIWYPATTNLGLDLTLIGGRYSVPTFNFWIRQDGRLDPGSEILVFMGTDKNGSGIWTNWDARFYGIPPRPKANVWDYVTIPVGPYAGYGKTGMTQDQYGVGWNTVGTPDWSDINFIGFLFQIHDDSVADAYVWLDGIHFEGWIIRAATDSTLMANGVKTRVITDPFAKFDTFKPDDPSGTTGLMAKAELLRLRTTPLIGSFTTRMQKSAMPGQIVHVHARPNKLGVFQISKDFRATQVKQVVDPRGFRTEWQVTDDVVNGMSRAAYDSFNEMMKNYRPEYQDRQATGIKMRDIDISLPVCVEDYPS